MELSETESAGARTQRVREAIGSIHKQAAELQRAQYGAAVGATEIILDERPTEAFAEPGSDSIVDCIRPSTGRSYINNETLEEIRRRYPLAEIITLEEHCRQKAARQDTPIEWIETTVEKYTDMMNVLPPAAYSRNFQGFLVGEPFDHHAGTGCPRFAAYRIRGGKYWTSGRPLTVAEFRGPLPMADAGDR